MGDHREHYGQIVGHIINDSLGLRIALLRQIKYIAGMADLIAEQRFALAGNRNTAGFVLHRADVQMIDFLTIAVNDDIRNFPGMTMLAADNLTVDD